MKKKIRVLLTDDHPVYRDGLRTMLESDGNIEIVAEASFGREALSMVVEHMPDLVLLDVQLPDMNGAEIAKKLREAGTTCKIMFLTMEQSAIIVRQAVELDVDGYLVKNSGAKEIIEAVRTVAGGEKYYSPAVAGMLMEQIQAGRVFGATEGLESLTATERKVLQLVASDRTSKEIAEDMGVSVRTIEGHRLRMGRKLGLSGAHSLVKFAFEHRDTL